MRLNLLLSDAARGRVIQELETLRDHLTITTLESSAPAEIGMDDGDAMLQPDLIWFSFDTHGAETLRRLQAIALRTRNLKWVQTYTAGLDDPVYRKLLSNGVRITKNSAQAIPIAEYVLGHSLNLLLPILEQRELQSERVWRRTPFTEIGQTRWTLVGFGSIGREIAKRLKPFGAHVTAVRRSAIPDERVDRVVGPGDMLSVIAESDVIVLACPLNEGTRDLADERFFRAMKRGSILINVSRGEIVVDDALRRGLDRNQPRHAVLDVFRREPLSQENWMWTHPNIRISAHTSNAGSGFVERNDKLFLTNLRLFLDDRALLHEAE